MKIQFRYNPSGYVFITYSPILDTILQNMFFRLPFHFIRPIRRRHLALGDILGMPGFESFAAFPIFLGFSALLGGTLDPLLSKPDKLDF